MDLIFKRYSSPFFIINEMIAQGQFNDYIDKLYDIYNEEKIYDIWLHKIYGQTYEAYRDSLNIRKNSEPRQDKVNVDAVVKSSFDVLNEIKPN